MRFPRPFVSNPMAFKKAADLLWNWRSLLVGLRAFEECKVEIDDEKARKLLEACELVEDLSLESALTTPKESLQPSEALR